MTELRSGSRRGVTAQVRAEIARKLVEDYGFTLAEVARQVVYFDLWSVEVVEPGFVNLVNYVPKEPSLGPLSCHGHRG